MTRSRAAVDRLVAVGLVLFLLGLSYVVTVLVVAPGWTVPATAAYLLVAAALVGRLLTEKENT